MIPQRNISLISNTLVTAGGRRIPEAVIERDYVLAWFLNGLAGHPLQWPSLKHSSAQTMAAVLAMTVILQKPTVTPMSKSSALKAFPSK